MSEIFEYECNPHLFPDSQWIYCSKQILLEENLILPCTKPDIESLVEIHAKPVIDEHKLIKSPPGRKLFIEGKVEQEILYVANACCQPVHAAHFAVPFHTFIDLPKNCTSYLPDDLISPKILIEFIRARRLGYREISKCLILYIWCPIVQPIIPVPQPRPPVCINSCSKTCKKY